MNWNELFHIEPGAELKSFDTELALENLTGELPRRMGQPNRKAYRGKASPAGFPFRRRPPRIRFPFSPWPGVTVIHNQNGSEPALRPDKASQDPASFAGSPVPDGDPANPDHIAPDGSEFEAFDTKLADHDWQGEVNRSSSDYIKWVQQSLNRIMGLRLAEDGINGPLTRSAVRSFQQKNYGLKVDGIVGQHTEHALIAAGAGYPPVGSPSSVPPVSQQPSIWGFMIGGVSVTPAYPHRLNVRNFLDPQVHHFPGLNRRGRTVNELIVHETVTSSAAATISTLKEQGLGVHLIMGPDGHITQHGDLADSTQQHAKYHNSASVGIEVVNPCYPTNLKPGMPWTQVINAGWAHMGRYVVPTPQQAEAVTRFIRWVTSPEAAGLSIPRTWIGRSGSTMAMSRVPGADKPKPGIYAHTYFNHSDGSWLVLYAFLRLVKGRTPTQAYAEAIQLATTPNRFVTVD